MSFHFKDFIFISNYDSMDRTILIFFLLFYSQPNLYWSCFNCYYFLTTFESLLQLIYFLHDILMVLTI